MFSYITVMYRIVRMKGPQIQQDTSKSASPFLQATPRQIKKITLLAFGTCVSAHLCTFICKLATVTGRKVNFPFHFDFHFAIFNFPKIPKSLSDLKDATLKRPKSVWNPLENFKMPQILIKKDPIQEERWKEPGQSDRLTWAWAFCPLCKGHCRGFPVLWVLSWHFSLQLTTEYLRNSRQSSCITLLTLVLLLLKKKKTIVF